MEKIDIFNLSAYLRSVGDNKLARIGHVNYVVENTIGTPTNSFSSAFLIYNSATQTWEASKTSDILTLTSQLITDTVSEATPAAGVTVDGVLLMDGLIHRESAPITTTGVTQTLAAGNNDVIFLTTTTGTDLAKISNTGINQAHEITLVYAAEGAGTDELVLTKLNAGDGIGWTSITFSTLGDAATLCWNNTASAWFIVALRGAVAA